MTESATRRPTPTQILAARVAVKADDLLGEQPPADIAAMAELPLPHEVESV